MIAFEYVNKLVEEAFAEADAVNDPHRYPYALGRVEARFGIMLNYLQHHHPEVFEKVMEM